MAARSIIRKPTRLLLSLSPLCTRSTSPAISTRHLSSSSSSDNSAHYSPLKSGDWIPPQIGPLAPDWDVGRWIFVFEFSKFKSYSAIELYQYFIKAVAPVLGSEEEAKKKIYLISCEPESVGFGAYVDEQTKDKIKFLPGVRDVFKDFYVRSRNMDPRMHGTLFREWWLLKWMSLLMPLTGEIGLVGGGDMLFCQAVDFALEVELGVYRRFSLKRLAGRDVFLCR
ncbi:hypothetical protein IFM89_015231 [Coptis chinensis]|uniref:MORF/ORRM1/DAG-like MORF domain-containing protein n=1 Tax=Coptis chinensis TaxID=261450 RepID=A0A835LHC8_9MAGN|nr:hypothetical protein IFM89_015231 [Coptis chinensis]